MAGCSAPACGMAVKPLPAVPGKGGAVASDPGGSLVSDEFYAAAARRADRRQAPSGR